SREPGVGRPRDLASHGITPEHLRRLCHRRLIEQPARGLYRAANAEVTAHHSLATVAKRVPNGVICLLSALRFHEFTTQSPPEVWVGIRSGARVPLLGKPMVRFVRYSAVSLAAGSESHQIEGVPVRVTIPAKTVADCFKYRNKIGLDVALEALRECRRLRRATPNQIAQFAKVNRVFNVMRPYLEALA
ncbi:MAG: type IV toxin-antitoxin system AbiEi family antitoxin domain-containing protein, partial [Acidobacteria bacterium]|nr:type IV toxin-antitoxin system AbiEi family antitoxin domain-containing protein [Acidobacteriota bacterium]